MLVSSLRFTKSALKRLGLFPLAKRLVGPFLPHGADAPPGSVRYALRMAIEQASYADVAHVHDLPPIFDYWAGKHLLPKCQAFGFSSLDEFFVNHVEAAIAEGAAPRVVSIGSGNCDLEIRVAKRLRERGHADFVIECLDVNKAMLARGRAQALQEGLENFVLPNQQDFNRWKPDAAYGAVIANQTLHHVVELEHLFEACKDAIGAKGVFAIADMIGRNGHQRWPEALGIVREFWRELPKPYRFNRQLGRQEDEFLDWDYSVSGFEGVRAQDILPLLVSQFHFTLFLPFGNLIDPFTDRAFGFNFDAAAEWDRAFIDRVHARDEQELLAGHIKPTHMFAVVQNTEPALTQFMPGLTPAFCVRHPQ
jgi:SAM-dependent methyltransferase